MNCKINFKILGQIYTTFYNEGNIPDYRARPNLHVLVLAPF